jgi:hypothetical protein
MPDEHQRAYSADEAALWPRTPREVEVARRAFCEGASQMEAHFDTPPNDETYVLRASLQYPMPDTPSPATSSPASLVDVAAARDALDEVLSAENDAVLAQTVSEVRSRLLALREALPGMHAALDRVLSLNADPFALERENDDLRLAVAHREQDAAELRAEVARLQRQTHVECAFMLDMQRQIFEAERRASEAEARATREKSKAAKLANAVLELEIERDTLQRGLAEARDAQRRAEAVLAVARDYAHEEHEARERAEGEVAEAKAIIGADKPRDGDGLVPALSWALDMLDMYDKRLAERDGAERVYSPTHVAGKAKARAALDAAMAARASAAPTTPTTETRDG